METETYYVNVERYLIANRNRVIKTIEDVETAFEPAILKFVEKDASGFNLLRNRDPKELVKTLKHFCLADSKKGLEEYDRMIADGRKHCEVHRMSEDEQDRHMRFVAASTMKFVLCSWNSAINDAIVILQQIQHANFIYKDVLDIKRKK